MVAIKLISPWWGTHMDDCSFEDGVGKEGVRWRLSVKGGRVYIRDGYVMVRGVRQECDIDSPTDPLLSQLAN